MGAALRRGTERLALSGSECAALDSRLLLAEAAGLSTVDILTRQDERLSEAARSAYERLLERRAAGEPVARILGRREFWSLPLRLTAETLVPRPETETLVEAALARIGAAERGRALTILDLGTGSGAILLALLKELPNAFGIGLDRSFGAAAAARSNAAANGLARRAAFLCGDFSQSFSQTFDVVVSNPPYISTSEIAALATEVRAFDPIAALDGGADGLDAYRALAAVLPQLMKPGGFAVVELGLGQEAPVAALFGKTGLWPERPGRIDLSGIPRALIVRNAPAAKKALETDE